jgi:hypothetical protein
MMGKINHELKISISTIIVIMIFSFCVSYDVFGSTNKDTKFLIKPGTISLQPSFSIIEFDMPDAEQIAYADAGTLLVTDATGSGAGWQVSVKASPLTEVGKEGKSIKELPKGSLTLSLENARIKVGEGSGVPPEWVGGMNPIIDKDDPTTLLSADREQGMGTYKVFFDKNALVLKIPKESPSHASYHSILTWSIQQGP